MYHVTLDLTGSQVKQLKGRALEKDTSVRGLVTELVVRDLECAEKEEVKSRSKQK